MTKDETDKVEVAPLSIAGALSTEKSIESRPEDQPQDGGIRAWLQVIGNVFMFFNVWGFTFAFGSFQSFYELTYLPDSSPSVISWIGSIQTFLLVTMGVVTGQLFDRGYFKSLIFTGATLTTFSVMMLSLSTDLYQIILTQGICIGLGSGMLFTPTMALIARSFKRQRAVAMGVAACGAPTGGILYTLMFEQLIPKVGFAWTTRIMGFVMLALYCISLPLLLWRVTNIGDLGKGTKRKMVDYAAFKDPPFWGYAMSTMFIFMGYLVPFFYMPTFAREQLGASQSVALYCLITSQAASVPGRLILATLAHRYGIMFAWALCAFMSAAVNFIWVGINTIGGFFAFCALYGFFSGPLIPLPTSIFPVVCPDPKLLGARLGMAQLFSAVANLVGPPIAGALVGANTHSRHRYLGVQLWTGSVILFGTCWVFVLWVLLVKKRHTKIMV